MRTHAQHSALTHCARTAASRAGAREREAKEARRKKIFLFLFFVCFFLFIFRVIPICVVCVPYELCVGYIYANLRAIQKIMQAVHCEVSSIIGNASPNGLFVHTSWPLQQRHVHRIEFSNCSNWVELGLETRSEKKKKNVIKRGFADFRLARAHTVYFHFGRRVCELSLFNLYFPLFSSLLVLLSCHIFSITLISPCSAIFIFFHFRLVSCSSPISRRCRRIRESCCFFYIS